MDGSWFFAIIVGLAFLVIGILTTLYIHRFYKWLYERCSPSWKRSEIHKPCFEFWEEFQEKHSRLYKGIWLSWLWAMRILGVMLAIAGALLLVSIIIQSLEG